MNLFDPQVGDSVSLRLLNNRTIEVKEVGPESITVGYPEYDFGAVMPIEAWRHFATDLDGRCNVFDVIHPEACHPAIYAVLDGDAEFVGRGNSGSVFRYRQYAVKVSSPVPYHPISSQWYQTIEQSRLQVELEHRMIRHLQGLDVICLLPGELHQCGEKSFIVMPWVDTDSGLTYEQCRTLAKALHKMHFHGYVYGDGIMQAGLWNGLPFFIDLGEARMIDPARKGIWSERKDDMESLNRLFEKYGHISPYSIARLAIADKKLKKFWERVKGEQTAIG
jgi:hypothetical protein